MNWWEPRETVTAEDVIADGACEGGVWDWIRDNEPPSAIGTDSDLLDDTSRSWVAEAARCSGTGSGTGYGYGYGDGSGYGYGSG